MTHLHKLIHKFLVQILYMIPALPPKASVVLAVVEHEQPYNHIYISVPELPVTNSTAILETLYPHCYSLLLLQTGMLLQWSATYWNAI